MLITKDKASKKISVSVYNTNIVWIIDPVSTTEQVVELIGEDTHLVIFSLSEKMQFGEDLVEWDKLSQQYKQKDIVLVFTPGEYQIQDIHMKGSSLDNEVHFVLETPEGTIGFLNGVPSDPFIKQYAPIDVLIGKDLYLGSSQLDFEPFFVILPSASAEYKAKAGVSDVKIVDKLKIKKIIQEARGVSASTEVYSLS